MPMPESVTRANARPSAPGVILNFETRSGAYQMPCDTFTDWEDNLRAITLTLERLRDIDRYGVTQQMEQYKGWAQLPAGPAEMISFNEAASFLADFSGMTAQEILDNATSYQVAYRRAATRLHPDAGGNHEDFVRLQQAAELLKARHGL